MTVQLSVDFNLKDKLHGILCSNDLKHYLKDCISCYTVCVIVICLLYQIMNNTVILKFAVCQISLISPMIKKSDKSPPMMNGDEGGQLSDLIGGDTVLMRGGIRLIGGIPPSPPPPLGKTLSLEVLYITIMTHPQVFGQKFTPIRSFFGKENSPILVARP